MTSYAPVPADLPRVSTAGWLSGDATVPPSNLGRGVLWGLLLAVPFWTAVAAGVSQLL